MAGSTHRQHEEEEDPFPFSIIWSAPATTPPLSEDEIKDIRQTLHMLHDLLRQSTPRNNNDNDVASHMQIADRIDSIPIRKRDKAKRFFRAYGPRLVGTAAAIGLGFRNVVTSIS